MTTEIVEPTVVLDSSGPLSLPENLTRGEWEAVGQKLREAEQWTQWAIGEWLNYGERKWGDTYKRAAEITGYAVSTLRKIACVTNKSVPAREHLTFAHHREVAPLEPAEQERWLDKAEREHWSTRELREQLTVMKHEVTDVDEKQKHIPACKRCGRECNWCRIELTPDSSTSTRRRR